MGDHIVNKNEWCILGLMRSGNHALINWLMAQTTKRSCFLNNIDRKGNPFCSLCGNKNRQVAYILLNEEKKKYDFVKECEGKFEQKDYLIYSLEDPLLPTFLNKPFFKNRSAFVGSSEKFLYILVLRDIFNNFASRLKNKRSCNQDAINMWIALAKEFVNETNFLSPKICVSFNEFFRSKDYRMKLSAKLGLKFRDDGIHTMVSAFGGGSSFDGIKYQGKIFEMKVNERWRHYANIPLFKSLIKNKEVVRLNSLIFPETKQIIETIEGR